MNESVLQSIVNSESLPSLPAVAVKMLELCERDDVNIQQMADVVSMDPALAAKLLKVSNSSMFGMSKKVGSIQQAMVVLGLRTVKVMSLGFSLADSMKSDSSPGFDFRKYWRRSISAAVAARQLACAAKNVRREEAFVGGLLCDVGMVAAARHPSGLYNAVIAAHETNGGRIQDIERQYLDVTHAEISSMMLAKWSMPEVLCEAVRAHHGDTFEALAPRPKALATVLWLASEVAELFCQDTDSTELSTVSEKIQSLTGITDEALQQVYTALNDNVREAAKLFSVELGEETSYDRIRQNAMNRLAEMSVHMERERRMAESRESEIRTRLEKLNQLNQSLRERASTDALTGIANRQAFDEAIRRTIEYATTLGNDVGLIMLDLDHFKKLNDTYGHQAGDEVLKMVGRCLKKISEESRFAARYGGEEFAVLVRDTTTRELRELAELIRKSISRIRFEHDSTELTVTASLGAAHVSFNEEKIDVVELIRRADECLYDAKTEGRNRVELTF